MFSPLDFMSVVEQTCIDMRSQFPINTTIEAGWYRCKSVEFTGETAIWELNETSRYSFSAAYKRAPHRQLMQAGDDKALRAFVKTWGPIRKSLDAWTGSDPIEMYRRERDAWTAGVRFLASVEATEMQRSALLDLAEYGGAGTQSFTVVLQLLRLEYQIPGSHRIVGFDEEIHRWLESATQRQIEAATVLLAPYFLLSTLKPGFLVDRNRGRNVLKASIKFTSLLEALSWMVWQDVFQNHPIKFCEECRDLIDSTYKHKKKFCSYECAHRQTARRSARRKREERKSDNGTHKTR